MVGITGYLLAKQGAKVTILERDSVASHASGFYVWNQMGALEGAGNPDPLTGASASGSQPQTPNAGRRAEGPT